MWRKGPQEDSPIYLVKTVDLSPTLHYKTRLGISSLRVFLFGYSVCVGFRLGIRQMSTFEANHTTGNHPWCNLQRETSSLNCGVPLAKHPGFFRIGPENTQSSQLMIPGAEQRTGYELVAGVVKLGQMSKMCILEGGGLQFIQLRSIRTKHQKSDRKFIKFHTRTTTRAL